MTTIIPERVRALFDRARREVDQGVLPSCQLALAHEGEVVETATYGDAGPETRYVMWSCSKAITGAAVWQLMSEGKVEPTTTVTEYLPEFGTNGKDVITVEQLLLHTAGIPFAPLSAAKWSTSESRRAAFTRWKLNWEPGSRYEYHPLSAHWVLAEIVETVTGRDYREVIRTGILEPLGLRRLRLGVPVANQGDIAKGALVGEVPPNQAYAAAGLPVPAVPPEMTAAVAAAFALELNKPEALEVGIPAGGAVSTAADLALFYQGLLHNPDKLWDRDVLADVTGTPRNFFPDTGAGGIPVNRTRGLVMAGDDGNGWLRVNFGKSVSAGTFGHDGAFGQIAWADPASGLSFAYLTNGLDQDGIRQGRRGLDLSTLAGLCTTP